MPENWWCDYCNSVLSAGGHPHKCKAMIEIEELKKQLTAGSMAAGVYMDRSITDFRRAGDVLLQAEQANPAPDNALIAFICDAIRLSREICSVDHRFVDNPKLKLLEEACEDVERSCVHVPEWDGDDGGVIIEIGLSRRTIDKVRKATE